MAGQLTKRALEDSLKRLLLQKPLTKITIADLTEDCGVSRMTFYYHFQDIYDLVEWACEEDAGRALANNKTADTWQAGLENIMLAMRDNKPFIMNVYHCVSAERIQRFLRPVTFDLIEGVVEEHAAGKSISQSDKDFLSRFFAHAFIGIMLDWIAAGMTEGPGKIVDAFLEYAKARSTQLWRDFNCCKAWCTTTKCVTPGQALGDQSRANLYNSPPLIKNRTR